MTEVEEKKQNLTELWRAAMIGDPKAFARLLYLNNIRYIKKNDIKLIRVVPAERVNSELSYDDHYDELIVIYMSDMKLILDAIIYDGEVQKIDVIIERPFRYE